MHSLANSALFKLSGEVSNNATWDEYIYFNEAGSPLDITGLSFQLQIRNGDQPIVTLSTDVGQLVITADDGSINSILRINVPYGTISGLDGDYQTDLVSKDANDKLTHWAHGIVTFLPSPIAF